MRFDLPRHCNAACVGLFDRLAALRSHDSGIAHRRLHFEVDLVKLGLGLFSQVCTLSSTTLSLVIMGQYTTFGVCEHSEGHGRQKAVVTRGNEWSVHTQGTDDHTAGSCRPPARYIWPCGSQEPLKLI